MHPDFLVPIAGMATGLILLLPVLRAVVRIAELEERVGFAERLLAQQRDLRRVEGGG